MTLLWKDGNRFVNVCGEGMDKYEALPVGTYTIDQHKGSFVLEAINNFVVPAELYGKTTEQAHRILQTFMDRASSSSSTSTGVLLTGEKGSGKTLLAKQVAILAAKQHGIPTIVMNKAWDGDNLCALVQQIQQHSVFLLDEFDTVFPTKSSQENWLTLLDGVYACPKKLFLFTSNQPYNALQNHWRNRPGRIYYSISFSGGLDYDLIRDYCIDHLEVSCFKTREEYIQKVGIVAALFTASSNDAFTMDMLQALVEEVNRYGESPTKVLEYLNVGPESLRRPSSPFSTLYHHCLRRGVGSCHKVFSVKVHILGRGLLTPERHGIEKEWSGNILRCDVIYVHYYEEVNKEEAGMEEGSVVNGEEKVTRKRNRLEFNLQQLEEVDPAVQKYTFVNPREGAQLVLTRRPPTSLCLNVGSLIKASSSENVPSLSRKEDPNELHTPGRNSTHKENNELWDLTSSLPEARSSSRYERLQMRRMSRRC